MTEHIPHSQNYPAVRRVLIWVLLTNLLVTVVKITLGFMTGALSVVADGFHSLVDSSSNLIGLAAIRLAERPADERHPYGYARYETIGSLAIGALLLVAAYEIGSAVVERIRGGSPPELSWLTFGLIALTFPVNLAVVILETRAGKRLNSQILLADATHTKTDLFITGSVVASLVGVWLGFTWLDPLVASIVVVMIVRAAFFILRDTAGWLADASILDPEKIEALVMEIPNVWYVHRIRSRGSPGSIFVDLHVKVYPSMGTEQAHAVATEVEKRIMDEFPTVSDVVVHIEPGKIKPQEVADNKQDYQDYHEIAYDMRRIADGMGLGMHDLHVGRESGGKLDVEVHLELPGIDSLEDAHETAEQYELRVRSQRPEIDSLITHLEPLPERVRKPEISENEKLRQTVKNYLQQYFDANQILEIHTHQLDGHDGVAIRIGIKGETSLIDAHNLSEQLERELLNQLPEVSRVIIHVEPQQISDRDM
ncbi:MAG: cation diffusion facilitator family transporter [Anaerolineales bacterium]